MKVFCGITIKPETYFMIVPYTESYEMNGRKHTLSNRNAFLKSEQRVKLTCLHVHLATVAQKNGLRRARNPYFLRIS